MLVSAIFITLSGLEKLNNSIFETPIIPQNLNINNLRTTSAKSINPPTIRKLIEYSLKKRSCKGNVYSYRFHDIHWTKNEVFHYGFLQ